MKFEEVLPALRTDKKVRRSSWWDGFYITLRGESLQNGMLLWKDDNVCNDYYSLSRDDLNADDWEIVKETKKVKLRDLTKEQFKKFCEKTKCELCLFYFLNCVTNDEISWLYHKEFFSDKFLDREIEIEEK